MFSIAKFSTFTHRFCQGIQTEATDPLQLTMSVWKAFPEDANLICQCAEMVLAVGEQEFLKLTRGNINESLFIGTFIRFPEHDRIQGLLCCLMARLAALDENSNRAMGDAEEVARLVSFVSRGFPSSMLVQIKSVESTLALLHSQHTDFSHALMTAKIGNLIVTALQEFPSERELRRKGLEALRLLCSTQEKGVDALPHGVLSRVIMRDLDLLRESPRDLCTVIDFARVLLKNTDARILAVDQGLAAKLTSICREHIDSEDVVTSALLAAEMLTENGTDGVEALSATGFLAVLLHTWTEHSDKPFVAISACKIIACLIVAGDSNANTVVEGGGCELLLGTMTRHAADITVQLHGTSLFRSMCICHPASPDRLLSAGGCTVLFRNLETFCSHRGIVQAVMSALQEFTSKGQKYKEEVGKVASVETCLSCLHHYKEDELLPGIDISSQCGDMLEWILMTSDGDSSKFAKDDGPLIFDVFILFPGNDRVQGFLCFIMATLAAGPEESCEAMGGVEEVARLVSLVTRGFPTSRFVQMKGVESTLALLQSETTDFSHALVDSKVFDVITSALQEFPSDRELRRKGLEAIRLLISSTQEGEEGAIPYHSIAEVIMRDLEALGEGESEQDVQSHLGFINALLKSMEGRRQLILMGLADKLTFILTNYIDLEDVMCSAVHAAEALVENNTDGADAFSGTGFLESLLNVWRQYGNSSSILIAAYKIVGAFIARDGLNFAALMEGSGLLLETMGRHAADCEVQLHGTSLLLAMCACHSDSPGRLLSAGACPILVGNLRAFCSDPVMVHRTLDAVEEFSVKGLRYKEELGRAGAAEALLMCLRAQNQQRPSQEANPLPKCLDLLEWILTTSDENFVGFMSGSSLGALITEVVLLFPENDRVQGFLCYTMARLASLQEESCKAMGGIEEVARLVSFVARGFPSSLFVQLKCVKSILALLHFRNSHFPHALMAPVIVDVTVTALHRFPSERELQMKGIEAIQFLCSTEEGKMSALSRENMSEVVVQDVELLKDSGQHVSILLEWVAVLLMKQEDRTHLIDCNIVDHLTSILKEHIDSEAVVTVTLLAMEELVENGTDGIESLSWSALLGVVLETWRRYAANPSVIIPVYKIVGAVMAVDELYSDILRKGGGCELLVETLEEHSADRGVQLHGSALFAAMCLCSGESSGRLLSAGGCRILLRNLESFCSDPAIIRTVLSALNWLTLEKGRFTEELRNLGAAGTCMSCLRAHREDCLIQAYGLRCIRNLENTSDGSQRSIRLRELISNLSEALRSLPESADIFFEALTCLKDLSKRDAKGFEDEYLISGISQLVVMGLEKLELHREAVIEVCKTIGSLARSSIRVREDLGYNGICSAFYTILTEHAQDNEVRNHVCKVMIVLAEGCGRNQTAFGDLGVCLLLPELWNYSSNDSAQQEGLLDLVTVLSRNSDRNKAQLGMAGVCELVVGAMENLHSSKDIQCKGCYAVDQLAASPDNAVKLIAGGACKITVEVLRDHGHEDLGLLIAACRTLGNFAKADRGTSESLTALGTCELAAKALEQAKGNLAIMAAVGLIHALMEKNPLAVDKFLQENTLGLLVDACHHLSGDQSQLEPSLSCIKVLVSSDGIDARHCLDSKLPELVIQMLEVPCEQATMLLIIHILTITASSHAQTKMRLFDLGVCKKLPTMIQRSQGNSMLFKRCCDATRVLSENFTGARGQLGTLGIFEVVLEMWTKNEMQEDNSVFASVCDLSRVLLQGDAANSCRIMKTGKYVSNIDVGNFKF